MVSRVQSARFREYGYIVSTTLINLLQLNFICTSLASLLDEFFGNKPIHSL